MPKYFCNCRCGCDEEVKSPFLVCSKCNKGAHKHLNLDTTIRRQCDACVGGDQVYDRSACAFICEPDCPDFRRESTQF